MKSFIFFSVLWIALVFPLESCPVEKLTDGATCLQLKSKIIYDCPYGFFYFNSTCRLGKVFPGEMTLELPYNESMQNTNSESYENLYDTLTLFFNKTFGENFQNISIISVKLFSVNKTENINNTTVTLIATFDEETNMTVKDLKARIENSTALHGFNNVTFQNKVGCRFVICDEKTTTCDNVEGSIPNCKCKPGLGKMNPDDKTCQVCDEGCSTGKNKICLMKADFDPKCQCLPNFEKKDGECKACSIGFSGEECQDSYMAIIIGVSTLCGILLLALIGVTTCVLVRKPEHKMEDKQLIRNAYSTPMGNPSGGVPPATNVAERGKMFPRIRATNGPPLRKANAEYPTNFYEGGAANRGYFPEQDYSNDNWLEMPSKY